MEREPGVCPKPEQGGDVEWLGDSMGKCRG